jgi:hypothetical protein
MIWLSVEDQATTSALLFGTLICLAAAIYILRRLSPDPCRDIWRRYSISAISVGFCAPVLSVLLMLFKSGLHGHGFPDYSFQEYLHIVQVAPAFILAALLLGLVAGAWRAYTCGQVETPSQPRK